MCICNVQIKETEHSSLRNSQGSWDAHAKLVRHHTSETDWALKDGNSPLLRVLGGVSADELSLTTVGQALTLLHTVEHACLYVVSNIVSTFLVQPQHDAPCATKKAVFTYGLWPIAVAIQPLKFHSHSSPRVLHA